MITAVMTSCIDRLRGRGRVMRSTCCAVLFAFVVGCAGTTSETEGPDVDEPFVDGITASDAGVTDGGALPSLLTPETLSNETIVALITAQAYRGKGFRHANVRKFPSTVAPGKLIDMWVSEAAFASMNRISPEHDGSRVQIPTGTVIVREVYDGPTLKTITVMVKLAQDGFPLGGDFWYGVTDPDGTIRRSDQGLPLAGLLQNCGTCHLRRSKDAFLFGTPDGFHP